MKNRSKAIRLCLVLSAALLLLAGCLFSGPDYAPTRAGDADFTFELGDTAGISAATKMDLNEIWQNADGEGAFGTRGFQPTLTDTSLSVKDGIIYISGVLDYGEGATLFESYGTMYTREIRTEFPKATNIYGDMNGFGNIHFAGFIMNRMEIPYSDENINLSIFLQRIDNHYLMHFLLPITAELFDALDSSVRSENRIVGSVFIAEDRERSFQLFRVASIDALGEEELLYEEFNWHWDSFLLRLEEEGFYSP